MTEKQYIKPTSTRVVYAPETDEFYKLEERRNELIKASAREWAKITRTPESEFWTRSLPQQLFDLLESFDHEASKMAAEAYLERYQKRYGN